MKCKCGNEMKIIDFGLIRVHYCNDCMICDVEYLDCKHKNFDIIALEMSNKKIMVKKYCTDCQHTFDNPLKHTEVDISKLHKSTNERYHEYIHKKEEEDRKEFFEFVKNRKTLTGVTYVDYIKSDEWKNKRQLVLKRDNYTCQICGKKAEQVHHLSYAHRENEYLFELVSLCEQCHIEHYHPEQKQK